MNSISAILEGLNNSRVEAVNEVYKYNPDNVRIYGLSSEESDAIDKTFTDRSRTSSDLRIIRAIDHHKDAKIIKPSENMIPKTGTGMIAIFKNDELDSMFYKSAYSRNEPFVDVLYDKNNEVDDIRYKTPEELEGVNRHIVLRAGAGYKVYWIPSRGL